MLGRLRQLDKLRARQQLPLLRAELARVRQRYSQAEKRVKRLGAEMERLADEARQLLAAIAERENGPCPKCSSYHALRVTDCEGPDAKP